MNIFLI